MTDAAAAPRPTRGRLLRWVRRVLFGLLCLVLVAVIGVAVAYQRLPKDRLAVAEPGSLRVDFDGADTTVGEYEVRVRGGDEPLVTVSGPDGVVWQNDPGSAFVTAAAGRVSWEEDRGYFWPDVDLAERWTEQTIALATDLGGSALLEGALSGDDGRVPWSLTLTPRPAGGIDARLTTDDEDVDVLSLVTGREDGAGVHGLGEQFAPFDLSGRLVPIVVREQGVGRGEQPLTFLADLTQHGAGGTEAMTYAAASSFVTDDLRGVRLDPARASSHAFAIADTRDPRQVGLHVWSRDVTAQLTSSDTPTGLVAAQQSGTTRPALADWTQRGAIVGLQGGTEEVREQVAALRKAGTEIAGVWLQDWTGQRKTGFGGRLWWTWQLDPGRYPGWKRLVGDLADEGIRTTTYVNPFLVDAEGRPGRNLFRDAEEKGYLVEKPGGGTYLLDQGEFDAALVDLSDADARDWFARIIARYVLADGVSGFMADFAESLPMDARLAKGDARTLHNRWPGLWAKTVRRGCELAGRDDCVTWFRSGSLSMDADTPLFWNGDQVVDWSEHDGLASVVRGSLSAGVSGFPLMHSDVGGYTSVNAQVKDYVRSPELLQRWGELAAFGVVLRTHEGNRADVNRQVYDAGERAAFARNSRIFAALADYRRSVLADATERGVPAIRPTWLVFPAADAARGDHADTQFFLGDSLLVAPVTEDGADSVEVALPPGTWVNVFTGRRYPGDRTVTLAAPLGTPAAFARSDDPWLRKIRAALADLS